MTSSIVDECRRRVESGILAHDEGQLRLAARLDRLASELSSYRPQRSQPRWRRLLPGNGESRRAPRGLYVWGSVGSGKTMLMDLFYERAPLRLKRRVHFHSFMQDVHGRIHEIRREQRRGEIWEDVNPITMVADAIPAEAILLCLDEFQVTDIADAMILGRLFEALFASGLIVVVTSNLPPGELYREGLNRQVFLPFIALLEERLDVFQLGRGKDYRAERIAAEDLYIAPLGPAADRRVERLWRDLTDGAGEQGRDLIVNGRTFEVPRTAKGVARFTFSELCGKPLGPADYLALAEAFHTVIVEHVPPLSDARRDEVRRFTTLIDTLYDRSVKVIVSAEEEPEEIYSGTRQAAEFARTASRLTEMRSAAYWHGLGRSNLAATQS